MPISPCPAYTDVAVLRRNNKGGTQEPNVGGRVHVPATPPSSFPANSFSNSLTLASNILFSLCTLAVSVCQNATSSLSRAAAIKLQSVPGLGLGLSAAKDVGRNEGDAVRLEEWYEDCLDSETGCSNDVRVVRDCDGGAGMTEGRRVDDREGVRLRVRA